MKALLVLLALAACGPSAREKAITTTVASLDVAAHAFVAFDAAHQQEIVASAGNRTAAETQLAAWRSEQSKIEVMLEGAYRAAAIAATVNTDASLTGLVQAALIVRQELTALKVLP